MIPLHIREPLSSAIESLLSAHAALLPILRALPASDSRDALALTVARLKIMIGDTAALLTTTPTEDT